MNALDTVLFHWVNAVATHPVLDAVMPVVTNSRVWAAILLPALIGIALRGGRRGRIAAFVLVITLALADGTTSQILKPAFGRERPCRSIAGARLLVRCGGRNGFPSNHAANAGAATAVLATFYPVTLWFVPPLAAAVAYSRVYVGVHYPGDVIAGLAYGVLVGLSTAGFARRRWLERRPAATSAESRPDTLQNRGG